MAMSVGMLYGLILAGIIILMNLKPRKIFEHFYGDNPKNAEVQIDAGHKIYISKGKLLHASLEGWIYGYRWRGFNWVVVRPSPEDYPLKFIQGRVEVRVVASAAACSLWDYETIENRTMLSEVNNVFKDARTYGQKLLDNIRSFSKASESDEVPSDGVPESDRLKGETLDEGEVVVQVDERMPEIAPNVYSDESGITYPLSRESAFSVSAATYGKQVADLVNSTSGKKFELKWIWILIGIAAVGYFLYTQVFAKQSTEEAGALIDFIRMVM